MRCSTTWRASIRRTGAVHLAREQMRLRRRRMATVMRSVVLVQTSCHAQLLARHRERVAAGEPSIIFGMQSFRRGAGSARTPVRIGVHHQAALAPPDDPVDEARAEWLRAVGRDPFSELVVPATAIRLAQWAGRAIRTEETRRMCIATTSA